VWAKRVKDLIASWLVGHGVLLLVAPRRRALLWILGPERLRKLTAWYAEHPTLMRLRGLVGVGLGIGLALRQYREPPRPWYQRGFSEHRLAGWLAPLGGVLVTILAAMMIYRRRRSKQAARKRGGVMPIARVIELSATSDRSFEDAINQGIKRATTTLRNVESAWIKDMNVLIKNNEVRAYKVNMAITFVLEEGEQPT
jgi:flavin-binding protein dodecin